MFRRLGVARRAFGGLSVLHQPTQLIDAPDRLEDKPVVPPLCNSLVEVAVRLEQLNGRHRLEAAVHDALLLTPNLLELRGNEHEGRSQDGPGLDGLPEEVALLIRIRRIN